MATLRKQLSIAAGAATLLLLVLPSLASANPGTGPELVQRSGRLVVVHADRFDGSSTGRQWMLVKGALHVPMDAPPETWIAPGTPVRLQGMMVDGTLQLADSATAVTQTGVAPMLAASTAAAPAVRGVAVIPVQFTGTTNSLTSSQALATMNNADGSGLNGYYLEQTYGELGFHATVFPTVTIAATAAQGCPSTSQADEALYSWLSEAEMKTPSFNEAAYQDVVLALPSVTACQLGGVAGIAEIGGNHVWINGAFSVQVLAHELGHNLGLGHAGGLYCTNGGTVSSGSQVTVSGVCGDPSPDQYVYNDPFDPMGRLSPVRQMSMEHKLALGLLPGSAVKIVGGPGTYRIAPMETLSGTPELLRIPKPGGGNYYVEYRQPIGFFDSQAPQMNGVYIRTEATGNLLDGNRADTLLVDMHPGTPGDWSDAAMDINQVFNDPLTGIAIQDVGQDASGATLQINAPHDAVAPSVVGGLTATAAGTGAALQWTAASDNYAVDHYVVARNGTQVGTTAGLAFSDTGLVPGSKVAYTVAAVDVGGNVGPAASAAVSVPDATPPSAPGSVTARLTKDGKVHVAWTAATDNGAVASYRVLRGGRLVASGNDFAYVDSSPKPGSGSTVTYSVAAVDLAGNAGPAGKAPPIRAALLRKLTGSSLSAIPITVGTRPMLRVKGKVSDARALCRLRIGVGSWHACRAQTSGAFSVTMPARGTTPVTLSLRDALGRIKTQAVRVGVQLVRVG